MTHKHLVKLELPMSDIFKKSLDPDNDLTHKTIDNGKDIKSYYKGKEVSYDDYLDIHEERGEQISQGKKPNRIGVFSGFGEGTMRKSYE